MGDGGMRVVDYLVDEQPGKVAIEVPTKSSKIYEYSEKCRVCKAAHGLVLEKLQQSDAEMTGDRIKIVRVR
jgi:hypothetical protein